MISFVVLCGFSRLVLSVLRQPRIPVGSRLSPIHSSSDSACKDVQDVRWYEQAQKSINHAYNPVTTLKVKFSNETNQALIWCRDNRPFHVYSVDGIADNGPWVMQCPEYAPLEILEDISVPDQHSKTSTQKVFCIPKQRLKHVTISSGRLRCLESAQFIDHQNDYEGHAQLLIWNRVHGSKGPVSTMGSIRFMSIMVTRKLSEFAYFGHVTAKTPYREWKTIQISQKSFQLSPPAPHRSDDRYLVCPMYEDPRTTELYVALLSSDRLADMMPRTYVNHNKDDTNWDSLWSLK